MSRPGRLIVTLTLAAVAAPTLPAQGANELAQVCKTVGDAKIGQWASFDATSGSEGGKVRLAIIGSQRSGDTTLYWFEVNVAAKDPSHSGVLQLLAPSLSAGTAGAHSVILKWGAQPAVKVSGQMAAMLIQKLEQVVSFTNNLFMEAPRLQEFFNVMDAIPAVPDRPDAIDTGRLASRCRLAQVVPLHPGHHLDQTKVLIAPAGAQLTRRPRGQ